MKSSPKIFICAGDPSGDLHAARLMKEIYKIIPNAQFFGLGGLEMQKIGFKSLVPQSEISVVGFWEVAKKYNYFKELLKRCKHILEKWGIDIFIPVDYPGFNIRLADIASNAKVPVYYYIAPQLWAWGKDRAEKLRNTVNKLMVVFPFEVDYFKKFDINTEYVGHPLLDDPAFSKEPLTYDERERKLAIFPGSRIQEIRHNLPIYEKIVNEVLKERKNLDIGIALAKNLDRKYFHKFFRRNKSWFVYSEPYELMRTSLFGVVKTGTSNLEACLSGLPFVMVYKTSLFNYLMGKYLVNTNYLSIVNIITKQNIVKEYIQYNTDPNYIAKNIINYISNKTMYEDMQSEFIKIRNILGEKGASANAANIIAKAL